MRNILVFGNSGSGKSTLANKMATELGLAHLDLDGLAWLPAVDPQTPPLRAPLEQSNHQLQAFIAANPQWIIEGCYIDLMDLIADQATEIIFMDLSVAHCVENAKNRPWEPHKYPSKMAQDNNLAMLIAWIEQYPQRQDVCSYPAHRRFYDNFKGKKVRYEQNP